MIMACTNLGARIIRNMLLFLAGFPNIPQGIELGLRILNAVQNFGTTSSRVLQNLSDPSPFDELVSHFDWIIELVNSSLQFIM